MKAVAVLSLTCLVFWSHRGEAAPPPRRTPAEELLGPASGSTAPGLIPLQPGRANPRAGSVAPQRLVAPDARPIVPDARPLAPAAPLASPKAKPVKQPLLLEPASPADEPSPPARPTATLLGDSALLQGPTAARPTAAQSAGPPVAAASFKGVQPGVTTQAELEAAWGKPIEETTSDTEVRRRFEIKPFKYVDVMLVDGTVSSLIVQLEKPLAADLLVKQLKLTDVRQVTVPDEAGEPLGQAFPERGVTFSLAPGGETIQHVLLETVSAEPFLLRAEAILLSEDRLAMHDLDRALAIEPGSRRAALMKGRLLLAQGQPDAAGAVLASFAKTDTAKAGPLLVAAQLLRTEVLLAQGSTASALENVKTILALAELSPLEQAEAERLLGNALAQMADFKNAIDHHQTAVKLAETLVDDPLASVRTAAKHLLVKGNLAVAMDIARGSWQQKVPFAQKWINRAGEHADDLVDHEAADAVVQLSVARGALAVAAALEGKLDPTDWTKQAIRVGRVLITQASDPQRRARLQWELGQALVESITADHAAGVTEHALQNARHTQKYLEPGSADRESCPETCWALARLYYRLGVVSATTRRDHATALLSYRQVLEQLPRPEALLDPVQLGIAGEMYLSMGLSYWEAGEQDRGLSLSEQGTSWIALAVKRRLTDPSNLTIAYNNLATMHEKLGNKSQAKEFSRMASAGLGEKTR